MGGGSREGSDLERLRGEPWQRAAYSAEVLLQRSFALQGIHNRSRVIAEVDAIRGKGRAKMIAAGSEGRVDQKAACGVSG